MIFFHFFHFFFSFDDTLFNNTIFLKNEFYWLTWFIVTLVIILPILLVCSILLQNLYFFPLTPLGITFITWFLYAASLIAFAMIFASFLNSAKVRKY